MNIVGFFFFVSAERIGTSETGTRIRSDWKAELGKTSERTSGRRIRPAQFKLFFGGDPIEGGNRGKLFEIIFFRLEKYLALEWMGFCWYILKDIEFAMCWFIDDWKVSAARILGIFLCYSRSETLEQKKFRMRYFRKSTMTGLVLISLRAFVLQLSVATDCKQYVIGNVSFSVLPYEQFLNGSVAFPPPPHFCVMILKCISLMVISLEKFWNPFSLIFSHRINLPLKSRRVNFVNFSQ